jgi:hypothetical protein
MRKNVLYGNSDRETTHMICLPIMRDGKAMKQALVRKVLQSWRKELFSYAIWLIISALDLAFGVVKLQNEVEEG